MLLADHQGRIETHKDPTLFRFEVDQDLSPTLIDLLFATINIFVSKCHIFVHFFVHLYLYLHCLKKQHVHCTFVLISEFGFRDIPITRMQFTGHVPRSFLTLEYTVVLSKSEIYSVIFIDLIDRDRDLL